MYLTLVLNHQQHRILLQSASHHKETCRGHDLVKHHFDLLYSLWSLDGRQHIFRYPPIPHLLHIMSARDQDPPRISLASASTSMDPQTPSVPSSSSSAIPAALLHSPSPPPMRRTASYSSASSQPSQGVQQKRKHLHSGRSNVQTSGATLGQSHSDGISTTSDQPAALFVRRASGSTSSGLLRQKSNQGVSATTSAGSITSLASSISSSSKEKLPSSPDPGLSEALKKKQHMRKVSVNLDHVINGIVLGWL